MATKPRDAWTSIGGVEGQLGSMTGYLEHLTRADLTLLAEAGKRDGGSGAELSDRLRSDPRLVERLLGHPATYNLLFGAVAPSDPLLVASPFLVFAVVLQRGAAELSEATFVEEWIEPRRRLPVFDVEPLKNFLDHSSRRLFLAELLASYTRVASGAVMVRTGKGWRRHRYSELDPVRFASLLEVVEERERPGIYRRLGDLALFLTGVFPDRSASSSLSSLDAQRLLRAGGGGGAHDSGRLRGAPRGDAGMLGLLEDLGQRWYRLAYASAPSPPTAALEVVGSVAEQFREARRILNFITDRYLFPHRLRWFPGSTE